MHVADDQFVAARSVIARECRREPLSPPFSGIASVLRLRERLRVFHRDRLADDSGVPDRQQSRILVPRRSPPCREPLQRLSSPLVVDLLEQHYVTAQEKDFHFVIELCLERAPPLPDALE